MHLLPLTPKTCLSLPRPCIIAVDTGAFLWYNFKYIVNNRVMEEEGSTMKATWKRALALLLAVMLAAPLAVLSEDAGEMLMLPDDVIATEAQDDLALDPDTLDGLEGLDDTSLELDLGANEGFELSEDLLVLDGLDEAAGTDGQDLALADNDWE